MIRAGRYRIADIAVAQHYRAVKRAAPEYRPRPAAAKAKQSMERR